MTEFNFNDLPLKSLKIICDKGRFTSSILRKRPAKYSNHRYKAKNKRPESALNTALSGKVRTAGLAGGLSHPYKGLLPAALASALNG